MTPFSRPWRTLRNVISISLLGLLVIGFSALMGWLFFHRGQAFLGQEQQLRLHSMATIASAGLSVENIATIHVAEDYKKPAYHELVHQLSVMREQNPDIKFAYILRPTADENTFEFVADADSLDPYAKIDLNKDGKIDDADALAPPGTAYDISDKPEMREALTKATTTTKPYSDQWGTYMSGFAPIVDELGKTVAIVGIDIDIAHYIDLSQRIFSPALFALLLLVGAILASYIVFFVWRRRVNALHSLYQERAKMLLLTFHQLGTPLTLVRWATDNLKNLQSAIADPAGKQTLARNTDTLTEAGNRFDSILKILRKADQIQAGKLLYTIQQANLTETINESIQKLKFVLQERQQKIHVNAPPSFLCLFDPEQIGVLITELITNASHYSPKQSSIIVSAFKDKNNIHVTVQDQGEGITDTDLAHLFEEFSRGKKASEQHPDGYGLGLYISKGIVKNANGAIWIESKPGKGSTVHFTLPQ